MQEVSAGILIYRKNKNTNEIEVLLGKCGGPRYKNRTVGAFNIPKGHVEIGENILDGAIREFEEETGLNIPREKLHEITYIGIAKTSLNKKVVHIYALEHDYAPNKYQVDITSNTFPYEYPPGTGNIIEIPELCEAYYFKLDTAMNLIFKYQQVFLERVKQL